MIHEGGHFSPEPEPIRSQHPITDVWERRERQDRKEQRLQLARNEIAQRLQVILSSSDEVFSPVEKQKIIESTVQILKLSDESRVPEAKVISKSLLTELEKKSTLRPLWSDLIAGLAVYIDTVNELLGPVGPLSHWVDAFKPEDGEVLLRSRNVIDRACRTSAAIAAALGELRENWTSHSSIEEISAAFSAASLEISDLEGLEQELAEETIVALEDFLAVVETYWSDIAKQPKLLEGFEDAILLFALTEQQRVAVAAEAFSVPDAIYLFHKEVELLSEVLAEDYFWENLLSADSQPIQQRLSRFVQLLGGDRRTYHVDSPSLLKQLEELSEQILALSLLEEEPEQFIRDNLRGINDVLAEIMAIMPSCLERAQRLVSEFTKQDHSQLDKKLVSRLLNYGDGTDTIFQSDLYQVVPTAQKIVADNLRRISHE